MILALGVSDCEDYGFNQSQMEQAVRTLESMETSLNVSISLLRERTVDFNKNKMNSTSKLDNESQLPTEKISPLKDKNANIIQFSVDTKFIKEFLVRKNFSDEDFMEVRVAVVGNVDAGKSTMLGVLTHGVLDDGRGEARTKLFRHKHEIGNQSIYNCQSFGCKYFKISYSESGRTSSVGNDILGFDASGKIINEAEAHVSKALDWEKICSKSSKVITFIDLAGHEKYLKTTV